MLSSHIVLKEQFCQLKSERKTGDKNVNGEKWLCSVHILLIKTTYN